jgi:hypothetical protein
MRRAGKRGAQASGGARGSSIEDMILRFARLRGPGTRHGEPDHDAIHVDEAGAQAARLLTSAPPGTYVFASADLAEQAL